VHKRNEQEMPTVFKATVTETFDDPAGGSFRRSLGLVTPSGDAGKNTAMGLRAPTSSNARQSYASVPVFGRAQLGKHFRFGPVCNATQRVLKP
jgi:hypothetical protein